MFDLVNVFTVFLPQLLSYPNPSDPLNGEAAALLLTNPERYKDTVRDYVQRYAKAGDATAKSDRVKAVVESDDNTSLSSLSDGEGLSDMDD